MRASNDHTHSHRQFIIDQNGQAEEREFPADENDELMQYFDVINMASSQSVKLLLPEPEDNYDIDCMP